MGKTDDKKQHYGGFNKLSEENPEAHKVAARKGGKNSVISRFGGDKKAMSERMREIAKLPRKKNEAR